MTLATRDTTPYTPNELVSPSLRQMQDSFDLRLASEHKAKTTRRAYMFALRNLADYLDEHGMPTSIGSIRLSTSKPSWLRSRTEAGSRPPLTKSTAA